MVTAESPWDDAQRDMAEAAWLAEHSLICPKCGNPREVCSDPERAPGYVNRTVCYASAAVERVWRGLHAKADGRDPHSAMDEKVTDGTSLFASAVDLTPDDHFL